MVFALDLTASAGQLSKYIDGALVGTQTLSEGVDGRWSLGPTALLFTDQDGETGVGYVSSIQFHNRALTTGEIAALGGPNAAGIPTWSGGGIAQWDFNGNLASSTGGANLSAAASAPATVAGATFTTASIGGQTAQVAAFTRGTFFRMTHGLAANGGGSYLNQYTLIMDVMFPSRPTGWAVLWQTNPNNANDGDWFINPERRPGHLQRLWRQRDRWHLESDRAGRGRSRWHVHQLSQRHERPANLRRDLWMAAGRWTRPPCCLPMKTRKTPPAMSTASSCAATPSPRPTSPRLGGPQAAGIPLPQTPSGLQLVSPNGGEIFPAGTTQTVAWVVRNASGLVQVDLLLGDTLYRALGQALMRQSNYLWSIDPQLGDTNTYRIRLTSVDFPSVQDVSDAAFSVTGSGVPPNPVFGQPLQLNGGFESLLANWQVVAGNPTTLTSAGGKGAPYAGSRFLYGGFSPGGNMIVRQDIDLLAAGFTAS